MFDKETFKYQRVSYTPLKFHHKGIITKEYIQFLISHGADPNKVLPEFKSFILDVTSSTRNVEPPKQYSQYTAIQTNDSSYPPVVPRISDDNDSKTV